MVPVIAEKQSIATVDHISIAEDKIFEVIVIFFVLHQRTVVVVVCKSKSKGILFFATSTHKK